MPKLGSKHQNLDVKVYQTLKTMIVERKLEPGAKIYQDKLTQDLGVSRTPVVNALKKLEQDKLISAIPRRGFYVRLVSREDMIQVFEVREVLEGLAARRAATLITETQLKKLQAFFHDFRQEMLAGAEATARFQLDEFMETFATELIAFGLT